MSEEYLLLKWGNLKGWNLGDNESAVAAFNAYLDAGRNARAPMAMVHLDDPEKEALCGLIDAISGPIQNDWTGEIMTKPDAKRYVREYGREKAA